jgi:hypothetical protein
VIILSLMAGQMVALPSDGRNYPARHNAAVM